MSEQDYERLQAQAEYLVAVVQRVETEVALVVVMDALVALYRRTQDDTLEEVEHILLRAAKGGG